LRRSSASWRLVREGDDESMEPTLESAITTFGELAIEKLANPGAEGQPEDQLRAPLEGLVKDLAEACGLPRDKVVPVGVARPVDLKSRPDFAVTVHNTVAGFIEVKAPGKGVDPRRFKDSHDREQWERLQSLPTRLSLPASRKILQRLALTFPSTLIARSSRRLSILVVASSGCTPSVSVWRIQQPASHRRLRVFRRSERRLSRRKVRFLKTNREFPIPSITTQASVGSLSDEASSKTSLLRPGATRSQGSKYFCSGSAIVAKTGIAPSSVTVELRHRSETLNPKPGRRSTRASC
jgi:hypothetical protein